MNKVKYMLLILSFFIVISGCTTYNDPSVKTVKLDTEPQQDPSVLLLQIKQLESDLASSKKQIGELGKQLSEQQKQIVRDEEIYNLRNQLDITAHTLFSAIRFDEMDRVPDLLSEHTSIVGNELVTKLPNNTMVYDFSWIKHMQSNLDTIRQRAYYLTDGEVVFVSIYEFRPQPDEQGESQIGIVHVEFRKENNEWKVFHLYNDI